MDAIDLNSHDGVEFYSVAQDRGGDSGHNDRGEVTSDAIGRARNDQIVSVAAGHCSSMVEDSL
jgi:hypothetical protein